MNSAINIFLLKTRTFMFIYGIIGCSCYETREESIENHSLIMPETEHSLIKSRQYLKTPTENDTHCHYINSGKIDNRDIRENENPNKNIKITECVDENKDNHEKNDVEIIQKERKLKMKKPKCKADYSRKIKTNELSPNDYPVKRKINNKSPNVDTYTLKNKKPYVSVKKKNDTIHITIRIIDTGDPTKGNCDEDSHIFNDYKDDSDEQQFSGDKDAHYEDKNDRDIAGYDKSDTIYKNGAYVNETKKIPEINVDVTIKYKKRKTPSKGTKKGQVCKHLESLSKLGSNNNNLDSDTVENSSEIVDPISVNERPQINKDLGCFSAIDKEKLNSRNNEGGTSRTDKNETLESVPSSNDITKKGLNNGNEKGDKIDLIQKLENMKAQIEMLLNNNCDKVAKNLGHSDEENSSNTDGNFLDADYHRERNSYQEDMGKNESKNSSGELYVKKNLQSPVVTESDEEVTTSEDKYSDSKQEEGEQYYEKNVSEENSGILEEESDSYPLNFQFTEILNNFLLDNKKVEAALIGMFSTAEKEQYTHQNTNRPKYTDVVGLFAKTIVEDYCQRISTIGFFGICTYYTFKSHAQFKKFILNRPFDKLYGGAAISYEWLLSIIYPESSKQQDTKYSEETTNVALISETELNINDMNVIWNIYSKVSSFDDFSGDYMVIYFSKSGISDYILQKTMEDGNYYSFYGAKVIHSPNELSHEMFIRSKIGNCEKVEKWKRLISLKYIYSPDALNLELYTPVEKIILEASDSSQPRSKLTLNVISKITFRNNVFTFNFIRNSLNNVTYQDKIGFPIHRYLIYRIFNFFVKMNDYPTADIEKLIPRRFYDELMFINGSTGYWKGIRRCKHFKKNFSREFNSMLQNIKDIALENKDVKLLIAIGETINKYSPNLNTIFNYSSTKKIFFPIKAIFEKDPPKKQAFILTIRKCSNIKNDDLYILFSPKDGVIMATDLPIIIPLFQQIIRIISTLLICHKC